MKSERVCMQVPLVPFVEEEEQFPQVGADTHEYWPFIQAASNARISGRISTHVYIIFLKYREDG